MSGEHDANDRGLSTLDNDVDGAAGLQRWQRRHKHLTYVLSARFIGGVPQHQRVSLSYLLIILHTNTYGKINNQHQTCKIS